MFSNFLGSPYMLIASSIGWRKTKNELNFWFGKSQGYSMLKFVLSKFQSKRENTVENDTHTGFQCNLKAGKLSWEVVFKAQVEESWQLFAPNRVWIDSNGFKRSFRSEMWDMETFWDTKSEKLLSRQHRRMFWHDWQKAEGLEYR